MHQPMHQTSQPQRKALKVTVRKGYLTRKLDVFSQNDSYIKLTLGNQKYQTPMKLNEEVPEWDQAYTFYQEPGKNILKFQVMDKDQLLDEDIGSGELDLKPFFEDNHNAEVYVKLKYDKKPAGKLLVDVEPEGLLKAGTRQMEQGALLGDQQFQKALLHTSGLPKQVLSNERMQFYEPQKHHKYKYDLQANSGNRKPEIYRQDQSWSKPQVPLPPYGEIRALHVPNYQATQQPIPSYVGYSINQQAQQQYQYPNPGMNCSNFQINNPLVINNYLQVKAVQNRAKTQQRSNIILNRPQPPQQATIRRSVIKIGQPSMATTRYITQSTPYSYGYSVNGGEMRGTASSVYYPVQQPHVVYVPRSDVRQFGTPGSQMYSSAYLVH